MLKIRNISKKYKIKDIIFDNEPLENLVKKIQISECKYYFTLGTKCSVAAKQSNCRGLFTMVFNPYKYELINEKGGIH